MTEFYYRASYQGEHRNSFFPILHSEVAREETIHITALSEDSAPIEIKRSSISKATPGKERRSRRATCSHSVRLTWPHTHRARKNRALCVSV